MAHTVGRQHHSKGTQYAPQKRGLEAFSRRMGLLAPVLHPPALRQLQRSIADYILDVLQASADSNGIAVTGPTEEYEGDFKAGRYAGQGALKYQDGRKYRGEFLLGRFHGSGIYTSADGQVYEGNFDKNIFTGTGTYKRSDGIEHRGEFAKWRSHGVGVYSDAKGNVYEGTFTEGTLNGPGRMLGKDGSRYEVNSRTGCTKARVCFVMPMVTNTRVGSKKGCFRAKATLTFAAPQKDGITHKTGVWRFGTLPNKEAARKTAANGETALYSQRALLDAALAAPAPRDAKQQDINLYLLAVGGNGS